MELHLALTLIWASIGREERRGEERQPLVTVTRAVIAKEKATTMMNQLCQGKQLPDSIYFMTFDSRGNNKDRKMTRKGKSEKRNRTTGNRERNERDGEKQRAGTRQPATPPLTSLDVSSDNAR